LVESQGGGRGPWEQIMNEGEGCEKEKKRENVRARTLHVRESKRSVKKGIA